MYLMSAPATKALLARAGEDDDARRVVLGELAQAVAELGQRLDVERVERFLPVDRDDGDRRPGGRRGRSRRDLRRG